MIAKRFALVVVVTATLLLLPCAAALKATNKVGDVSDRRYTVTHKATIPLDTQKDGDLVIAAGGGDMYYTGYRGSNYNSQIVAVNLTLQKQVCSFGGRVRGAQHLLTTTDGKYVIASHQVLSTGGSTGTFYIFNSTCDLLHTRDGYNVQFINDTHVLYTDSYYVTSGGVGERKTKKVLMLIPECITLPEEPWLRPNSEIPGRSIQNNFPENRYHVYDRTGRAMVDMYTNSTISKFEGDRGPGAYYHGFDGKYYYFTDVSSSGVLGYLELWGRNKVSKLIHKLPTPYPLVIAGCSYTVYSPAIAPQVSVDDTTVTFLNGYCFSESDVMTISIPQNGSIISTTILGSGNAVVWKAKKRIVAWGETNFTVASYPGSASVVNTSVGASGHENWIPPQPLGDDSGLVMSWNNVEGNGMRACVMQVRSVENGGELVFHMEMPNPKQEYIPLVSAVLPSIRHFVITAHDKAEVFTWKLNE